MPYFLPAFVTIFISLPMTSLHLLKYIQKPNNRFIQLKTKKKKNKRWKKQKCWNLEEFYYIRRFSEVILNVCHIPNNINGLRQQSGLHDLHMVIMLYIFSIYMFLSFSRWRSSEMIEMLERAGNWNCFHVWLYEFCFYVSIYVRIIFSSIMLQMEEPIFWHVTCNITKCQ